MTDLPKPVTKRCTCWPVYLRGLIIRVYRNSTCEAHR